MVTTFSSYIMDFLQMLWRYPSELLRVAWLASCATCVTLTALITRWIVRRRQSRALVLQLKRELAEERARHARAERAHEAKLAVYREAAILKTVTGLMQRAEEAAKRSQLVIRR